MFQRFLLPLVTLFLLLLSTAATGQETSCGCKITENTIIFKGPADIVDGDTIWIGIHKVRLNGIEALEKYQRCIKSNQRFRCYEKALDRLKEMTADKDVTCKIDRGDFGKPVMSYNRYLGTCYVDNIEINHALVTEGWVVAAEDSLGDIYREAEKAAKKRKAGIHQTIFDPPWVYRKQARKKYPPCPSGTHQCIPK